MMYSNLCLNSRETVPLNDLFDLLANAVTTGAVGALGQPVNPHLLRPVKSVNMFYAQNKQFYLI